MMSPTSMAARGNRTAVLAAIETMGYRQTPLLLLTEDAGAHWTNVTLPAFAGTADSIIPWSVTFDTEGDLHVAGETMTPQPYVLDSQVTGGHVFHAVSNDLGQTWGPPTMFPKESNWPFVAAGFLGKLGAIVWPEQDGLRHVQTVDGGKTWSQPKTMPGCNTPSRILARNGGLDALCFGGRPTLLVHVAANASLSAQPLEGLRATGFQQDIFPDFVASPNGTLATAIQPWADGDNVYVSSDGGSSWEDATPGVPEGWPQGGLDDLFLGGLAFDRVGRLHGIAFLERHEPGMPVMDPVIGWNENDAVHEVFLANGTLLAARGIASDGVRQYPQERFAGFANVETVAASAWVGDRLLVATNLMESPRLYLYSVDLTA